MNYVSNKQLSFLILILFTSLSLHSQGYQKDWEQFYSTSDSISQYASELDPNGNVFVVGSAVTATGSYDQLFLKYDPLGNLVWSKKIDGGNGDADYGKAVLSDGTGNSVWCGHINSSTTEAAGLYSYDVNGNLIWAYNSAMSFEPISIKYGVSNDVICVGNTANEIIVESINISSGTLSWSSSFKRMGAPSKAFDFEVASNGDILIGGYSNTGFGTNTGNYILRVGQSGISAGNYFDTVPNSTQNAALEIEFLNDSILIVGSNYETTSNPGIAQLRFFQINLNTGAKELDKTYNLNFGNSQSLKEMKVSNTNKIYAAFDSPNNITLLCLNQFNEIVFSQKEYSQNSKTTHLCLKDDESLLVSFLKGAALYYNVSVYDETGGLVWSRNSLDDFKNSSLTAACFDSSGNIFGVGYAHLFTNLKRVLTLKFSRREMIVPPDYYGDPINQSCIYFQNKGQLTDEQRQLTNEAKYVGIGGYPLPFANDSSILFVEYEFDRIDSVSINSNAHRVDVRFVTDFASDLSVIPVEVNSHRQNYYTDYVENGALEGVSGYSRLVYPEVWQNIDVHLYSGVSGNKLSFVVTNNQAPSSIKLKFQGQSTINLVGDRLEIGTTIDGFGFDKPVAYQVDGANNIVALPWRPSYVVNGNEVTLSDIGVYDPLLPLIIQLEDRSFVGGAKAANGNLEWSSYISTMSQTAINNNAINFEEIIDVDANNDKVYYLGFYETSYLPGGATSYTSVNHGNGDAMVIAFDHDNMRAIHSTFLGGNDREKPTAISVTDDGFVIGGYTLSRSYFPTLDYAGAPSGIAHLQSQATSQPGSEAGFISRFSESGLLEWSTYVDNYTENEYILDVELSEMGEVFVAGYIDYASSPAGGNWLSTDPILSLSNQTSTNFTKGTGFILKFGDQCEKIFFTDVAGWTQVRAIDSDSYGNLVFTAVSTSIYNGSYDYGVSQYYYPDPTFTVSIGGQTQIENGTAYIGYISSLNELRFIQPYSSFGTRNNVPHDVKINDNGIIDVLCSAEDGLTTRDFGNGGYYKDQANQTYEERDMYLMELEYPSTSVLGTTPTVNYASYFGADLMEDITNGNPMWPDKFQIHRDQLDNVYLVSTFLQGAQNSLPPVQSPLPATQPNNYYYNNFAPTTTISAKGYIAALDSDKNLIWSTFWGGESYDEINGSALVNEMLYIGGQTNNSNYYYPLSPYPFELNEFISAPGSPDYFNSLGYSASYGARFTLVDINTPGGQVGVGMEESETADFIVFPNPVSEALVVRSEYNFNSIIVYDTRGRLIESINCSGKEITIDFANYSKGLYMLTVISEGGISKKKVQKI